MLPPRRLGSTGITVTPIGLGTVKLGRNAGLKYPGAFEIPTDLQAADLLRAAQRLGVTLLDTAPAYGQAEERLGRILSACGGRDRWTIITKAGEAFDPATSQSTFDFSPAAITSSVERSLKRLRTDRVECALLHSDGRDQWIIDHSGAMDALERLRRAGKARSIGISTKSPEGALHAVSCGRCDVVMMTLNPDNTADLGAVQQAGRTGVGVLIKKALASGHLAQASALGAPLAPTPSPIEASLALCLGEPAVSSVVLGTINPRHLEENVQAARRVLASA